MSLMAALSVSSAVLAWKAPQFVAFESARVVPVNPAMAAVDNGVIPAPGVVLTSAGRHQARNHSQLPAPRVVQARNVQARNIAPGKNNANVDENRGHPEQLRNVFLLQPVMDPAGLVDAVAAVPAASTETIFLVVQRQTNGSGQPVVEIQWWRLTVLHSTPRSTGGEIPKKT